MIHFLSFSPILNSSLVDKMSSREDLIDAINFYDTLGDHKISVGQVGLCLRAAGLVPTESHLSTLTSSFNSDSRIGIDEIVPMAKEVHSRTNDSLDLSLCLAPFDRESNGLIGIAELRHILLNCGDRLSVEEVEILLQGVDISDGKVNIPVFIRLISTL